MKANLLMDSMLGRGSINHFADSMSRASIMQRAKVKNLLTTSFLGDMMSDKLEMLEEAIVHEKEEDYAPNILLDMQTFNSVFFE